MKLPTFTLTSISFFSLTMAGEILFRASPAITFCTSTGFGGQCNTYQPGTGSCNPVPAPYVDSLFSSHASPGSVCFLYRGGDCTGCEACADAEGWSNMGSFAAVHSFKCVVTDAAGCSNAFTCSHH